MPSRGLTGGGLVAVLLTAGCVWRAAWLVTGPVDACDQADEFRQSAAIAESTLVDSVDRKFEWLWFPVAREFLNDKESVEKIPVWAEKLQVERCLVVAVEQFDDAASVWLTSGVDGQPGWATWDDNRNGIVDDASELGAAWSDDDCVVSTAALRNVRGPRRVVDRGAWVNLSDASPPVGGIRLPSEGRVRVVMAASR